MTKQYNLSQIRKVYVKRNVLSTCVEFAMEIETLLLFYIQSVYKMACGTLTVNPRAVQR